MQILNRLQNLISLITTVAFNRSLVGVKDDRILDLVESARIDWHEAKVMFEQTVDPRLVEYAAYELKAKERRYVYLLECARKRSERVLSGV